MSDGGIPDFDVSETVQGAKSNRKLHDRRAERAGKILNSNMLRIGSPGAEAMPVGRSVSFVSMISFVAFVFYPRFDEVMNGELESATLRR